MARSSMEEIVFLDHRQTSVLNSGRPDRLLKKELFAISSQFAPNVPENSLSKRQRKRARSPDVSVSEWPSDALLEDKLKRFVEARPKHFVTDSSHIDSDGSNEAAKAAATCCPSAFFFQGCSAHTFNNTSDELEQLTFQNREFILPPNSCGLLGAFGTDITAESLLKAAANDKYDLIVMDPPWTNKSVKRQRRYMTGPADNILSQIPMTELLAENGLLVVWHTHNESHYQQLKSQLTDWNLRILANWTWLKVTTSGQAICPFGRNFKKPYEHLVLAARVDAKLPTEIAESDGTVLVSVPSAVHSHKPNLDDVLERILSGSALTNPRRLELFARSLKSRWVCAGNEVIKLQCTSLFS